MKKTTLVGSLMLAALLMSGCERRPSEPRLPKTDLGVQGSETVKPPVADPSLPAAAAVLAGADGKDKTPPSATLHTAPLTPAAESTAMPLGGQANDHSAPKSTEPVPAAAPRL